MKTIEFQSLSRCDAMRVGQNLLDSLIKSLGLCGIQAEKLLIVHQWVAVLKIEKFRVKRPSERPAPPSGPRPSRFSPPLDRGLLGLENEKIAKLFFEKQGFGG